MLLPETDPEAKVHISPVREPPECHNFQRDAFNHRPLVDILFLTPSKQPI